MDANFGDVWSFVRRRTLNSGVARMTLTRNRRGADVEKLGTETICGNSTERYRLVQTDDSRAALNRLAPFELAWFELESPDAASRCASVTTADSMTVRH